jgi:CDAN1-interacting nuclease 1
VMDRNTYSEIVRLISIPSTALPNFHALSAQFNVSYEAIYSIYSQDVQNKIRKTHTILIGKAPDYARRFLAGHHIIDLCHEADTPPCNFIRRILHHLPIGSIATSKISEILKQPSCLPSFVNQDVQPLHTHFDNNLAAAASFIQHLQEAIQLCIKCDGVCSPESDTSKRKAGQDYEDKLYNCLNAADIAHWTEDTLRKKGFHKTPDARLTVPIAVKGRLVGWIDSKATFGDDKVHKQQAEDQYSKYVNRFGPGLVIYWHGHLVDLDSSYEDILVMDRFPDRREMIMLPRVPLIVGKEEEDGGGEL